MITALQILNRISHFHGKSIGPYIELFGSIPTLLKESALRELEGVNTAGAKLAARIRREADAFDWEEDRRCAEKLGVRFVSFFDDEYPPLLKEIATPPLLLYVRGNGNLSAESVCGIVGSRRVSLYGREIAERFGRDLARDGTVVVSGFARGVDTAAHRGCVSVGGATIAVLGCGVDVVYPRENARLVEAVLKNDGAIVSEFSMGVMPMPYHFPQRNRIIAGLAHGVIVVEASQRSGSLITSRYALDEGRLVFSVPGRIDHAGAYGSNKLLQEGAILVSSVQDVRDALHEVVVREKQAALSADERDLLALLSRQSLSMEELCEVRGCTPISLCELLTRLELKQSIVKTPDGKFCRVPTATA